MNNLFLIIAIFAAGFGVGWRVDNWRFDSIQKVENAKQMEIERVKSRSIVADYQRAIDVQNASNRRIVTLRNNGANLRNQLDSLRSTVNSYASARVGETASACNQRVVTLGTVFNQCAEKYSELAGKADAHVEDVKTLTNILGE